MSRSALWANLVAPRLFVGACPQTAEDVRHIKHVAAWLHWRQGWDLAAAVEQVHRCRQSQPNPEAIQRACRERES